MLKTYAVLCGGFSQSRYVDFGQWFSINFNKKTINYVVMFHMLRSEFQRYVNENDE